MAWLIRHQDGRLFGICTNKPGLGNKLPDGTDEVHEFVEEETDEMRAFNEVQAAKVRGQGGAAAMLARQRSEAVDQLDSAIAALPAVQQPAFRLIQQLLKE